jgi:NAD(P)-dependent dehydrogenase (short-subunit alcohol dehydrogenase family)
MQNQVVLITGSTDGIGRAAAIEAARRGADVIVHGRSAERVAAVQQEIAGITGDTPTGVTADFSSLKEVRDLARRLNQDLPRLDVLINNAGIISQTQDTSRDGYELTFAVNHLAPFLLTTSLLELLRRSSPARVVTVSSMVHHGARIDFDDLMQERGYDGMRAYGQSKLANVLFTVELARRESATRGGTDGPAPGAPPEVTAVALHPGVIRTKVLHEYFSGGAPVAQGAENVLVPALDPRYRDQTGVYFSGGRPEAPDPAGTDPAVARRLWEVSTRLCDAAL